MKAFLILEDGTVFKGTSIGSTREVISEIVFNTSMTGYLEVLTDPSSCRTGSYNDISSDWQTMAYAIKIWSLKKRPDGFIVRELSRMPSNFRNEALYRSSF